MSWTLTKTFRFEAAHHLPHHDGKCQRQHGHSWVCTVEVRNASLINGGPKTGMVLDYGDISTVMTPLLENVLDHYDLNETTGLESPTSECLAKYIYDWLFNHLPLVSAVTIAETCTSACEYRPGPMGREKAS